ncbi:helix-turn-helix transcriptional regulator [Paraburkholderia sediminicola]|uniref:Helix-turn-helix transcriptional regulator n=1 Tax=Paraburkholderia rhynchosiae TaxID=487049 RepID=A0ACC7N9T9_9BURK
MTTLYPLEDISATGNAAPHIPQRNCLFGIISDMEKKLIREVLADNIRRYMREIPFVDTQVKLSKRAGISQSSVARVLSGQVDTQISIVAAIADAIGVSAADLLAEPEEKPALDLDLMKLARLPKTEQEKIKSFADFVFTQAAADGTVTIVGKVKATSEQETRARRAARRPLSNDSLSIDRDAHHKKKERGAQ